MTAPEKSTGSPRSGVRTRVVHVMVAGNIGGAERMLIDLASRPDESRADHTIALFSPNEELAQLLADSGLRVRDRGRITEGPVQYLWRSFGPSDAAFVERVLREEQADICHLHVFASHVLGTRAALAAGTRIVRTDHSARAYKDLSCFPFSLWSLRHADLVVAVSEHLRKLGRRRAPWSRVPSRVVMNGVDTARFGAEEPRAARDGAFTFVLVGRLEPRKNVTLALDALAKVPGARLSLVGDGPERAALERHAKQIGVASRVTFHGFQRDVRSLVKQAHAGLSSSREEGLGIGLLEIMAMGRPVVAVPVGGMPEIVKNGVTGRLAARSTVDALATAMRSVAHSTRGELGDLGRSARRFVEDHASVGAMCAGYADAYDAALMSPRPARPAPARAR